MHATLKLECTSVLISAHATNIARFSKLHLREGKKKIKFMTHKKYKKR